MMTFCFWDLSHFSIILVHILNQVTHHCHCSNMENTSDRQPLLCNDNVRTPATNFLRQSNHSIESSSFIADADDIPKITGIGEFYTQFVVESKKLWYLAGPAIFTSLCQYSLGAITQTFAGQVGTLDLAAFSVENSVIAGFSFGTLVVSLLCTQHMLKS